MSADEFWREEEQSHQTEHQPADNNHSSGMEGMHQQEGRIDHHYHGGSEEMNRDYMSERRQSRMNPTLESDQKTHMGMPGAMPPHVRQGASDRQSGTIHRRRPGGYGDPTRMRDVFRKK